MMKNLLKAKKPFEAHRTRLAEEWSAEERRWLLLIIVLVLIYILIWALHFMDRLPRFD
jgi:hypothetical protein